VRQQQMAFQVLREILVRFYVVRVGAVGVFHYEALIPFAPVVLVYALIVIA
jgi:hypothetical protein